MINWEEIDTVLLDMDGTLLDLHFDNYFWLDYVPVVFSEKFDVALEDARKDLHARFERERGSMQWYCLDYWTDELDLDIVGLKEDIVDKIAMRPFAGEFLEFLNAMEKHVILLTNAHRGSLDLKMANTDIHHHFHELISTHDYGIPKEDIRLWDALRKDHDFNPERTALVDDTESVLESAQRYGIKHLLTILQPDSKKPPRDGLSFTAIDHFSEVISRE